MLDLQTAITPKHLQAHVVYRTSDIIRDGIAKRGDCGTEDHVHEASANHFKVNIR